MEAKTTHIQEDDVNIVQETKEMEFHFQQAALRLKDIVNRTPF